MGILHEGRNREFSFFLLRAGRKYFWALRPAHDADAAVLPAEYLSVVKEHISAGPESFKLIEVGCGDGRVLRHLADHYPKAQYVGVDLQQAAVDLGNKKAPRPNIQLVCASCLSDDIPWQCDYLISRTVLIYLNSQEIRTFLRKRLPQTGRLAILQEIVSTTGETERSHFYAHPLADLIGDIAPGQFELTQETLAYEPWRGDRWTGANLVLTRTNVDS